MTFHNYRDFLVYNYKALVTDGRVEQIVTMVKEQPKGPAFDFGGNTKEGQYIYIFFLKLRLS